MNTPDSPQNTVGNQPNPTPKPRKPRQLRIGEREIAAMCDCLAQRMTEREGCQVLGVNEATWYRWKSHAKNSARLSRYLDRITAQKIQTHIANIEAGAVGAGPHKRADWRASLARLSLLDPSRFQSSGGVQVQVNLAQPAVSCDQADRWISAARRQTASGVPGPREDTWTPRLITPSKQCAALPPAEMPKCLPPSSDKTPQEGQ